MNNFISVVGGKDHFTGHPHCIPMVRVPRAVRVYDSGPWYFDRFTVVFPDDSIYTMSANAKTGICRYEGQNGEVPKTHNAVEVDSIPVQVAEKIMELV